MLTGFDTQSSPQFAPELIRRYDVPGPRYTSYPSAKQFHDGFGAVQYATAARATNRGRPHRPLSLYFHLPFCDTVCFYCACNRIVTRNRAHATRYLEHLCLEIALQGALFDGERTVDQLHWGGGTPTFFDESEMRHLMKCTREHFALHGDDTGEYSVEVDPRQVNAAKVECLRTLGFNRMSIGVQDFDPRVQTAVNRVQSETQTRVVLEAARSTGFKSISLDLIYGLPRQSVESFRSTLEKVIALEPDRLSIFNYAHLPQLFKTQRQIDETELPSPEEKLRIMGMTIERLLAAGYVYIGMDHFARPEDELAAAQRGGSLSRNFQGYSTRAGADLVAMGITGIGSVGNCHSQNVRDLETYFARTAAGQLPVYRGFELSDDDRLRRDVIKSLICHGYCDFDEIETRHAIQFSDYFANELAALATMHEDGLVATTDRSVEITDRGKLLVRNVCMVFDAYLEPLADRPAHSRTI